MRRLLSLGVILLAALSWLATSAIGDDRHSYRIELDNAFGITPGSQVRVAGVNVGTVSDVEINAAKRAEVAVDVAGELATFGTETECSSEPQSLIAEYFVDCDPAGPPLAEGGLIPVSQTRQTVQADLVQATFREPFKRRLQLLVSEFGTGLAGNAENLNEAIRRGAPALGELDEVIGVLADRNRTIEQMVADSDRVLAELSGRKADVRRFVTEAREISDVGARRRAEVSESFGLLDDFLADLTPTLAELRTFSQATEPLLTRLQGSSVELTRMADVLPGFADASRPALRSLGRASVEAKKAVDEGAEEVPLLRRSGRNAKRATEPVKHFARDIDDPGRIVEYDRRAARTCDDDSKPCWATGRTGPTGYTGMEGLLNYAYFLAGATNQVDQVSHILHVGIYTVADQGDPCGAGWWTGREPDGELTGVPAEGGGRTTDFLESDLCVSWLGASQPGINEDLGLPPYDPAVCPEGSVAPELCDPGGEPVKAPRGKLRRPGDIKAIAKQLAGKRGGSQRSSAPGKAGGESKPAPGPLGDLLDPVLPDSPLGQAGETLEDLGDGLGKGLGVRFERRRGDRSDGLELLLGVLFGGAAR
jgi:virulence factor Mce-like protein